MKLTRRDFTRFGVAGIAAAAAGWPGAGAAAPNSAYTPVPKGDSGFGSYTQSWFLSSFFDLPDDLSQAKEKGKRLAILWELDGCPYCREMHLVNFAIPEVTDYIRANFEIIQMDLRGSNPVVGFDGKEMSEKEFAKHNGVRFTPTIQFFPETLEEIKGKAGRKSEVARMPGYFKPFHFLTMFQYVREKAYDKTDFRSYLKDKTAALSAQGKTIPNW